MVTSEEFERLVAGIYRHLSTGCRVQHNVHLPGIQSGTERQIDVLVEGTVAGEDIRMIVECKHTLRNLTVQNVDSFLGVVQDVHAHKGVLVARRGFSKNAVQYARRCGISLCTFRDAETRDWKKDFRIPIVWEEVKTAISCSAKLHLLAQTTLPSNYLEWLVSGRSLGERFVEDWNLGRLSTEPGTHNYDCGVADPILNLPQTNVPLQDFETQYHNERDVFFGFVDDLPSAQSLHNAIDGSVRAVFRIADVLHLKDSTFVKYDSVEDIPSATVQQVRILTVPVLDVRGFKSEQGSLILRKLD